LGANLETGDVATIYENNDLGFPNYSIDDDILVFGTNYENKQVIGEIALQADKINSTGDAYLLIDVAKWPLWYATGDRDLMDVKEQPVEKVFFSNIYPNPASGDVSVVFNAEKKEDYRITVTSVLGQIMMNKEGISTNGLNKVVLDISNLTVGTYVVNISVGNKVKTHKIVKIE